MDLLIKYKPAIVHIVDAGKAAENLRYHNRLDGDHMNTIRDCQSNVQMWDKIYEIISNDDVNGYEAIEDLFFHIKHLHPCLYKSIPELSTGQRLRIHLGSGVYVTYLSGEDDSSIEIGKYQVRPLQSFLKNKSPINSYIRNTVFSYLTDIPVFPHFSEK